ncbi:hypothetical protein QYF36_025428 [Acer negundo]|nr:hypothetical protein QYF36_025428 [Acer negundo]
MVKGPPNGGEVWVEKRGDDRVEKLVLGRRGDALGDSIFMKWDEDPDESLRIRTYAIGTLKKFPAISSVNKRIMNKGWRKILALVPNDKNVSVNIKVVRGFAELSVRVAEEDSPVDFKRLRSHLDLVEGSSWLNKDDIFYLDSLEIIPKMVVGKGEKHGQRKIWRMHKGVVWFPKVSSQMLTTGKGKGKWVQSSRSKLKMSTNLNVNGCGPLVAGGLDRSNMEDVSMGRYGSDVGIQFLGLEGLARVLANVSKNVKPIVRSHAGFESQDQVNTSNDQVERDGDDLAKRVEVDYREVRSSRVGQVVVSDH